MILSSDYADLLQALNDAGAKYLIVGAHALAYHGRPHATVDLDVWIEPSRENARRVYRALGEFGAPLEELSIEDLTDDEVIFQIGTEPFRVDILTGIDGVTFRQAWKHRIEVSAEGLRLNIIGREDFIKNKRAAGRLKDLADLQRLQPANRTPTKKKRRTRRR